MFDKDQQQISGLIAADAWMSEKVATALTSISYNDSFFALEEFIGWYGDIVGRNPAVEDALTLLAALVVTGDLELIADTVRDALYLRRSYEDEFRQKGLPIAE